MVRSSVTRRDVDDSPKSFDVAVVRSAVDFLNACTLAHTEARLVDIDGQIHGQDAFPDAAKQAFGWIAGALERYASLNKIEPPVWKSGSREQLFHAYMAALLGFAWGLLDARPAPGKRFKINGRDIPDWIDLVLSTVPIYTRIRYQDGRAYRVSVPLITSPDRAVAYALALVAEDQWSLTGRVKRCPWEKPAAHFFVDYRIAGEGRFLRGEQVFCCSAHSNAHRQHEFRKRQSAPRRHK